MYLHMFVGLYVISYIYRDIYVSVQHLCVHTYIHSSPLDVWLFIMAYQIHVWVIQSSRGGACGSST